MFEKILCIGAHPDDIEIGAGALISRLKREYKEIIFLVLSCDKKQRREEAEKSAKLLGAKIIFLFWNDGCLRWDMDSVIEVEEIINMTKPNLIITHNVNETHQDHVAAANITFSAARNYKNILMYDATFPSGRSPNAGKPNVYFSVTKEDIEKRNSALGMHKSQCIKYGEDWVKGLTARNKYYGSENCNDEYAETFVIGRLSL